MKNNKTLFVLLLVPFLIGLLSFASVLVVKNLVAADITDILWSYKENEGFRIQSDPYLLSATAVKNDDLVLAEGNGLVWKIETLEGEEPARLEDLGEGKANLYALHEGSARLTCSNERGTRAKHFVCHIFKNGAIVINPKRPGSGERIDPTLYYGLHDLVYTEVAKDKATLREARFELVPTLYGEATSYRAEAVTSNVSIAENVVTIRGAGEGKVRYILPDSTYAEYTFTVLPDSVNVYSYNDLLMATNFSSKGYTAVLQTNLESLANTYRYDEATKRYTKEPLKENTALFGNYDFEKGSFSFEKEVYRFETTYNADFIDQYNAANGTSAKKEILAGIHLTKGLYGNGFTINAHELAYPTHGSIGKNGKLTPGEGDLFKGPLPFLTVGSLEQTPIVKAFGQDNSLLYVDGEGARINDVRLRNTNELDNLYDLTYVGSVVDLHADNITIENSVLSFGRTVLRAYDTPNLLVENSILRNANEFVAMLGSDKRVPYETDKRIRFAVEDVSVDKSFAEFYDGKGEGTADGLLEEILKDVSNASSTRLARHASVLRKIQEGLDSALPEGYAYEASMKNVSFANSGVFSIAFESAFNGPYLYNGMPEALTNLVTSVGSVKPSKLGSTSLPVHLTLDRKCRFYDWKDVETIDVSSLVEENISQALQAMGKDYAVTIDDFFPIKSVLRDLAKAGRYLYAKDGKQYLNSKVAWFGGGVNASILKIEGQETLEDVLPVDLIEPILSGRYATLKHQMVYLASDAILVTIGFHPFSFALNEAVTSTDTPPLFGEAPSLKDLIAYAHSQGGN